MGTVSARHPTIMTHAAENVPSCRFNELCFRDLDGPLPHGNGNKPNWLWFSALTSCYSPKTPWEQNLCHCHLSCPQTHCHGILCHASHCWGTLSHSNRCHPFLHPRVRVGVYASCCRAMPHAHGCCRYPPMPIPALARAQPHLAPHNRHCTCWPCRKVGLWGCRTRAPGSPPWSKPFLGSFHAPSWSSTGTSLNLFPQTCDRPVDKWLEIRLFSTCWFHTVTLA